MPRLIANGIEIEYETMGHPSDQPLLLIMGLGAQLITWDDGFCRELADRGFYVIRFDNRDAGLSTKMEEAGPADVLGAFQGNGGAAYTLDDMADDAVGVLGALEIAAAHIVGASMGGFIAQLVAINHPGRVLSLTSIMSGPGGEDAVPPTSEAAALLVQPPAATRDGLIDQRVAGARVMVGVANPLDAARVRRQAERAYDRSYYPAGYGRQLVASLVAPSRVTGLRSLKVPTLVVHGIDDPLIPLDNGRRTAAAVPGARLIELKGMGHNVPESYWPLVADAIAETARRANVART